jgi:hypothetical protein
MNIQKNTVLFTSNCFFAGLPVIAIKDLAAETLWLGKTGFKEPGP